MLFQHAQEVSCLDGNMLPHIPDKKNASIVYLGNPEKRGTHLSRLEAGLINDDDRTTEISRSSPDW